MFYSSKIEYFIDLGCGLNNLKFVITFQMFILEPFGDVTMLGYLLYINTKCMYNSQVVCH